MLFVQLPLGLIDFIIKPLCLVGKLTTLGPEFADVVFSFADSLLGLRLVHERKEDVPNVLDGEGPWLIEVFLLPIDINVRLFECRFLISIAANRLLIEVVIESKICITS